MTDSMVRVWSTLMLCSALPARVFRWGPLSAVPCTVITELILGFPTTERRRKIMEKAAICLAG
jgi:hypothetical protein